MYNKKYNDSNKNLELRNDLFCTHCHKQCKNLNSLHQHECRCKENPNRKSVNNFSNQGWAKGLSKDSDIRIKHNSESKLKYYETHEGAFIGKHHTQEFKDYMSKIQTELDHSAHNRNSHGKRGYFDNIFFMSTWELSYYIYMKDNFPQEHVQRCIQRFKYYYKEKYHYYTPDFILSNGLIVEIKGWETELDKVKYEVVDNLQVLYYDDIKPMIKYVKNKYHVETLSDLYFSRLV